MLIPFSDLLLEWAILISCSGLALWFKPWQMFRQSTLQSPWLGALVLLPWVWSTGKLMPSGLTLHLSAACLLVLMFGWPLAVWTLLPIALLASWITAMPPHQWGTLTQANWTLIGHEALVQVVWYGLIPATVALGLGLMTRRWLVKNLFVYILGRGFISTALAMSLSGALAVAWHGTPRGLDPAEMLIGHWLMSWGEAFATGMLTAIFVAFRPDWLATYSDKRYLPD